MIKKLSFEDVEEVKNLFLSVFSNPPWNDVWVSDEYLTLYLKDLMDQQNSMSLGFVVDKKLIGLSLGYTFHWWQGKDYFIKEFCIKTDEQGKGLGSMFLNEIESYLLDQGVEAMYLMTEKEIPAFNFYHKNGFKLLKDSVMFAKNIVDNK
ncbi:MAG: hypothetical protein A2Y45_06065 [Tenericutes bacterium GWC2_34_14]|nr:MAG: hypothetical protein A2Z84_04160 [Tenericutes bacterium GWA2_35_7]OHE28520.1 MAG: hypothetical protein A2Y45_06065 [Tenericutes bacterium GWC2_34_14]OHE33572.1 MAG: hypothetical protein A2012_03745 [Tenericutes bacterium GWE2_34_108]OHE36857.1 MAG: hypothetical protein A2Y46_09545 [Tenericutes bacterium GWF1_35_14]OHE38063.1 MAG: hypothetical protein A2Y44_09120 [Tenericutes bacterium GWF2_35_184]OHE42086.1 MAG: hypothetical protein A3K26_07945 [Tenericutes bacterium RIFOXYA12_FULL_35_